MFVSIKKYGLYRLFFAFFMSIYAPVSCMEKQASLFMPQLVGLASMITFHASSTWNWLCKEQYSADLFSLFRGGESLDESDVAVIKHLLKKGADVAWKHGHTSNLLYRASEIGRIDLFELILDNGALDCIKDNTFKMILNHGNAYGNRGLKEIALFVQRGIVDPNTTTQAGLPLLHYVALGKDIEGMKVLIKAGAQQHTKARHEGEFIAAHELALISLFEGVFGISYHQPAVNDLEYLVKNIKDINLLHYKKQPLVYCAAKRGNIEAMKLFIKVGAQPMVTCEYDGKMVTAYELALMSIINSKKKPLTEDIEFLIEAGKIDLNGLSCISINSNAIMPLLCCAIEQEHEEAVEMLVNAGADLHARTEKINEQFKNLTPLHLAVFAENNKIIRFLISAGAHPDLKATCNGKRVTPLEFAQDEQLVGQEQLLSNYRSIC